MIKNSIKKCTVDVVCTCFSALVSSHVDTIDRRGERSKKYLFYKLKKNKFQILAGTE